MDGPDNGDEERKEAAKMGQMKARYDEIYKSLDYGPISSARGLTASKHVSLLFPPGKTLCVGSGNSYEAASLCFEGFKVTTLDYVQPRPKQILWDRVIGRGQELPFKDNTFELVMCCECIEHIPDSDIDQFMLELKRVGTRVYFTVDDVDDPPYHTHVCLHPPEWWIDKFNEWGFAGTMNKPSMYQIKVRGGIAGVRFNSDPPGRGFNFHGHKVLS